MTNLVVKIFLAYMIGAILGAIAALLAIEYNWNIVITLVVACVATLAVDFGLLRVKL